MVKVFFLEQTIPGFLQAFPSESLSNGVLLKLVKDSASQSKGSYKYSASHNSNSKIIFLFSLD